MSTDMFCSIPEVIFSSLMNFMYFSLNRHLAAPHHQVANLTSGRHQSLLEAVRPHRLRLRVTAPRAVLVQYLTHYRRNNHLNRSNRCVCVCVEPKMCVCLSFLGMLLFLDDRHGRYSAPSNHSEVIHNDTRSYNSVPPTLFPSDNLFVGFLRMIAFSLLPACRTSASTAINAAC